MIPVILFLMTVALLVQQGQILILRHRLSETTKKVDQMLPASQDKFLKELDDRISGKTPDPPSNPFDPLVLPTLTPKIPVPKKVDPPHAFFLPIPPPPSPLFWKSSEAEERARAIALARESQRRTNIFIPASVASLTWKAGTIFRDRESDGIWMVQCQLKPTLLYNKNRERCVNRVAIKELYEFTGDLELLATSSEVLGDS